MRVECLIQGGCGFIGCFGRKDDAKDARAEQRLENFVTGIEVLPEDSFRLIETLAHIGHLHALAGETEDQVRLLEVLVVLNEIVAAELAELRSLCRA